MKKIIKEIYPYIIVLIIAILIKSYVGTLIRVKGPSMKDTLENNDIMLLDKISYRFSDIKRFDIVVVKYQGEFIIKRVIGLPNETIRIVNNILYINDKAIKEKYINEDTINFTLNKKIEKEHYFVMGDNRDNSKDSRIIGTISKNDILGKTSLTLFPFNRLGFKK